MHPVYFFIIFFNNLDTKIDLIPPLTLTTLLAADKDESGKIGNNSQKGSTSFVFFHIHLLWVLFVLCFAFMVPRFQSVNTDCNGSHRFW